MREGPKGVDGWSVGGEVNRQRGVMNLNWLLMLCAVISIIFQIGMARLCECVGGCVASSRIKKDLLCAWINDLQNKFSSECAVEHMHCPLPAYLNRTKSLLDSRALR